MATDNGAQPQANDWYVDTMRRAYQADPTSVDPSWRAFTTESAPPQLRVPQPIAEAAPAVSHPVPVQAAVFSPAASSIHDHPTTHFAHRKRVS